MVEDLRKNADSHKKVDRVCFCARHCVFSAVGSEVLGSDHTFEPACYEVPALNKAAKLDIVRRRVPDSLARAKAEREEAEAELQAAIAAIEAEVPYEPCVTDEVNRVRHLSSDSSNSESESVTGSVVIVSGPPAKRCRLADHEVDLDRTVETSSLGASSPKDDGHREETQEMRITVEDGETKIKEGRSQKNRIAKFQKAVSREEAKAITPQEVNSSLRNRMSSAIADKDRAVQERDELRGRLLGLQ